MTTQSDDGSVTVEKGSELAADVSKESASKGPLKAGPYGEITVKTAASPAAGRVGEVITYETTITNLSESDPRSLRISDTLIGAYNDEPDIANAIELGPSESIVYKRSVTLSTENASRPAGFISATTVEVEGSSKEPVVVEEPHELPIAIDSSSQLRPSDIENLARLAGHAQLFIRPQFGKLEQVEEVTKRTSATFAQMQLDKAMSDGVRNHLVTLGFRDLSRILLGYTHPTNESTAPEHLFADGESRLARHLAELNDDSDERDEWPDANFCTFGTWASLTIGRNVRNRFAPRRFDQTTTNAFRGAFTRLAIDVRQTNKQRLSRLLAAAQGIVFDELNRSVENLLKSTDWLEGIINDELIKLENAESALAAGDRKALLDRYAKIEPILARQIGGNLLALPAKHPDSEMVNKAGAEDDEEETPNLPAPASAETGRDERYADLVHGLVSYLLARHAHNAGMMKARSELIFRGNVLIESYVQIKVQQVLDYSVDEIASSYFKEQIGVEASENRGAGRWRRRINRVAAERFEQSFGDVWSRVLTDQVLVARVGDEVIRLGRDIPDPPGSSSFFPEDLDPICDGWANNLLLRFDHSFGYGTGTRSHNWGVYDDRMNWLVNLLRSRQQSFGVWKEPFTLQEEVLVRAHQDPTDGLPGGSPWTR